MSKESTNSYSNMKKKLSNFRKKENARLEFSKTRFSTSKSSIVFPILFRFSRQEMAEVEIGMRNKGDLPQRTERCHPGARQTKLRGTATRQTSVHSGKKCTKGATDSAGKSY